MEPQTFKEEIIQNIDSIKQCIVERARHEQEIQNRLKRLNERKLQIQECMVQKVKASDASSGAKDNSRIEQTNIPTKEMIKIQKQLKNSTHEHNAQELTEYKSILAETSRTLGESDSVRDSCLVALQNKQTEFERYKAL
ncbi:hypothetical protein Tco_0291170 [Tanacetum coccineum]